jgi:hypothetical protein
MEVVDTRRHRGEFFKVLQQTERSQTAVMTIAPGADAGPEERHGGPGRVPLFFVSVYTPPEY